MKNTLLQKIFDLSKNSKFPKFGYKNQTFKSFMDFDIQDISLILTGSYSKVFSARKKIDITKLINNFPENNGVFVESRDTSVKIYVDISKKSFLKVFSDPAFVTYEFVVNEDLLGEKFSKKDLDPFSVENEEYEAQTQFTIIAKNLCAKRVTEVFNKFFAPFIEAKKPDSEIDMYFLAKNNFGGFTIDKVPIEKRIVDTSVYYGHNFSKVDASIKKHIETKGAGLFWFHGDPGTGKTSYIYHLMATFPDKKFLIVPSNYIGAVSGPELINLLSGVDCLIFEDAENVLLDRKSSDQPELISSLLNMTDGMFAQAMRVKIIITSNKEVEPDSALVRKGRLKVAHNFRKLTPNEATIVAKTLGKNIQYDHPVSLSDIFNSDESNRIETVTKEKKSMGFSFLGNS